MASGLLGELFPAQLLTRVPSQQISQSNFFYYYFYSSDLKTKQTSQVKPLSLKLPSAFLLHLESTRFPPRTLRAAGICPAPTLFWDTLGSLTLYSPSRCSLLGVILPALCLLPSSPCLGLWYVTPPSRGPS